MPTKAVSAPRRDAATATLAGAPPGLAAYMGMFCWLYPVWVKSMRISPMVTMRMTLSPPE